jgi:hypothetical protein
VRPTHSLNIDLKKKKGFSKRKKGFELVAGRIHENHGLKSLKLDLSNC